MQSTKSSIVLIQQFSKNYFATELVVDERVYVII